MRPPTHKTKKKLNEGAVVGLTEAASSPASLSRRPWPSLLIFGELWAARRGRKKRLTYRCNRYREEKNQVIRRISSAYEASQVSQNSSPFKKRLLTCQLKAPGRIVKLATEVAIPACSTQAIRGWPAINLKSESPLFLSISTPNQTKVIALLQQQKMSSIAPSS